MQAGTLNVMATNNIAANSSLAANKSLPGSVAKSESVSGGMEKGRTSSFDQALEKAKDTAAPQEPAGEKTAASGTETPKDVEADAAAADKLPTGQKSTKKAETSQADKNPDSDAGDIDPALAVKANPLLALIAAMGDMETPTADPELKPIELAKDSLRDPVEALTAVEAVGEEETSPQGGIFLKTLDMLLPDNGEAGKNQAEANKSLLTRLAGLHEGEIKTPGMEETGTPAVAISQNLDALIAAKAAPEIAEDLAALTANTASRVVGLEMAAVDEAALNETAKKEGPAIVTRSFTIEDRTLDTMPAVSVVAPENATEETANETGENLADLMQRGKEEAKPHALAAEKIPEKNAAAAEFIAPTAGRPASTEDTAATAENASRAISQPTFSAQNEEPLPLEMAEQPQNLPQNGQADDVYGIQRQVVEQARLIRSSQNTEMVIQLKPESLGQLTLRVSVANDGAVTASFHSDNAQVRAALESSMLQLKQELQEQGLKVDNVSVYSGLSEDFFAQSQGQMNQQQNYNQSQPNARDTQMAARALENGGLDSANGREQNLISTDASQPINNRGDVANGVDYRI